MFIIQQGGGRLHWDHTPVGTACWISACVGAGATAAAVALQWLLIRKRVAVDIAKEEEEQAAARAAAEAALADVEPGRQLEGGCSSGARVDRGWGGAGKGLQPDRSLLPSHLLPTSQHAPCPLPAVCLLPRAVYRGA